MKRIALFTLPLGLLVLGTAGAARAQMMGRGMGTMMPGQGPMMGAGWAMMPHGPGMGSIGMHHGAMIKPGEHLLMMLRRARLTASQDLQPKIQDLEDRYYEKILRHRAEIQIAKHRLFRLFQDPNASEQDLRKARKNLAEHRQAVSNLCFQGMLELRKVLGPESFARLFGQVMDPSGASPQRD